MLFELLYYAMIGGLAGLAAGMLGVGGGLIIVPLLLIMFETLAVIPYEHQAHVAIATSLLTIVFTSLSAIYAQHKKQAIDWQIFFCMAPGLGMGAFFGAGLASMIPRSILLLFFALFLCFVALKMWVGWSPHSIGRLPGYVGMTSVALAIGIVSSLAGIGGGTMTVPFLTWGKMVIQRAIAVSSALGLPIALAGSMGFYLSRLGKQAIAEHMLGFVYLPAFLSIVVVSVATAGIGVVISHKTSKLILSRIFAVVLVIQAFKLFLMI